MQQTIAGIMRRHRHRTHDFAAFSPLLLHKFAGTQPLQQTSACSAVICRVQRYAQKFRARSPWRKLRAFLPGEDAPDGRQLSAARLSSALPNVWQGRRGPAADDDAILCPHERRAHASLEVRKWPCCERSRPSLSLVHVGHRARSACAACREHDKAEPCPANEVSEPRLDR